jgi:hypothetical protein
MTVLSEQNVNTYSEHNIEYQEQKILYNVNKLYRPADNSLINIL